MSVSQAINASSFARYIASTLSYLPTSTDNNLISLSDADKNKVIGFLLDGVSNVQLALNIKSANNMINKLRKMIALEPASLAISSTLQRKLLSSETAKQLLDKQLPSEKRCYFSNFRTLLSNPYLYGNLRWVRIDNPSAEAQTLTGTLVGGGGGGSGGITGDGDKNASYTVKSGAGASGGTSYFYVNNEIKASAIGGAGGNPKSEKAYENPVMRQDGNNGTAGSSTSVNVTISPNDIVYIVSGYGGGGGGGCAATAGGTTGSKTYTASSGNCENGGNHRLGANEWTGDDSIFAGGGGGGSASYSLAEDESITIDNNSYLLEDLLVGYLSGKGGSSNHSGPSGQVGTKYYGANGGSVSIGAGGLGGYASSGYAQPAASQSFGSGGSAGKAKNNADVVNWANGGNGGTRGGFTVNSDCTALDCLMAVQCGTYMEEQQTYKESSQIIFTSSGYGGYELEIYDYYNGKVINSGDIVPVGTKLRLRFTLSHDYDVIKSITINDKSLIGENIFGSSTIYTVAQGATMNIKVNYEIFDSVSKQRITISGSSVAYNPNNYLLTNNGTDYSDPYDGFGIRFYTTSGVFLNAITVKFTNGTRVQDGFHFIDDLSGDVVYKVIFNGDTVECNNGNLIFEYTYYTYSANYEV
ncbi:MAG: hypothetical protein IJB10_03060 [Clostridia bacterium]|nr:hypothetical protein [Clostridia bacterium]